MTYLSVWYSLFAIVKRVLWVLILITSVSVHSCVCGVPVTSQSRLTSQEGCRIFRGFAATQLILEHRSLRVSTVGVNPQ